MKYIVITPAYNEEIYINYTIGSMIAQSHKPEQWVIVDDGSDDRTADIVRSYLRDNPWIKLVTNPVKEPRSFGPKVVRAFNIGMSNLDVNDYECIVKLDADLTLPPNYFEHITEMFQREKDIGICGGIRIYPYEARRVRSIAKYLDHVSGGMKAYRRECYNEMGGLMPVIGWDLIDEHIARHYGWRIGILPELIVIHHRYAMGYRRKIINKFFAGIWYYRMGFDVALLLFQALKHVFKNPPVLSGILVFAGYCYAWLSGRKKFVDKDIALSVRRYSYKQMYKNMMTVFNTVKF